MKLLQLYCVAVGDLPGMVLGGGWVEWKEEIRIKEVFIEWVGQGRAPPKRTFTKITVLGLIRPETSTYIYIERMSHCDIPHFSK